MRKVFLWTVCSVFMIAQSGWGISTRDLEIKKEGNRSVSLNIEIPERLASLDEIYEAPAKLDPKLLLHIQNAHGIYEAQLKIKELLDYLYEKYGFQLVFVEGAAEALDREYMRLFPDSDRNLAFADTLAQRGELTGVEYYLMNAPQDVEVIGIEQAELYRANYETFKKIYLSESLIQQFVNDYDARLEMLSSRYLSSDARRLLAEWKKFGSGHREFLPYVKQLTKDARRIINVDLESFFAQVEWPQIARLLVLQAMETDLNRAQALREKDAVIDFLKNNRLSDRLIRGVESLDDKQIRVQRVHIAESSHEFHPRYLLERLAEEAGPAGFQFHQYPQFSLYAGYLILRSELESTALFEEIEMLFEKVLNELTVSDMENNLLELFRDAELMRKLMNLELSRKEWQRAAYRRSWIGPQAMLDRMNKMNSAVAHAFDAQRAEMGVAEVEELDQLFNLAFRFYDYARQRESVFYYSIKQGMQDEDENKAVLVSGGFHTEGLMDMFRKDDFNYGVITPRLTEKIDHDPYVATMMENRPTVFDLATLEIPAASQRSEVRIAQGVDELAFSKRILDAYLDTLVKTVASRDELQTAIRHFSNTPFSKEVAKVDYELSDVNQNTYVFSLPGENVRVTFPQTNGKTFAFQLTSLGPNDLAVTQPEITELPELPVTERLGPVDVVTGQLPLTVTPTDAGLPRVRDEDAATALRQLTPTDFDVPFLANISLVTPRPDILENFATRSPREQVAALTRLVIPEDATADQARQLVSRMNEVVASGGPSKRILDAVADDPLLSYSDRPAVFVTITDRVPTEDEIESYLGLVASHSNLVFNLFVDSSSPVPDAVYDYLSNRVNEVRDWKNQSIKGRLDIIPVNVSAVPILNKYLQQASEILYRHLRKQGVADVPGVSQIQSQHMAVLVEAGIQPRVEGKIRTLAKIIRGAITSDRGAAFISGEKVPAATLALFELWETLKQEVRDALKRYDDRNYDINEQGVGVFAQITVKLKAIAKLATAA